MNGSHDQQTRFSGIEPPDYTPYVQHTSPGWMRRLHTDDRGEHALEVLMILAFGILPMISAVWLLEDVIREYVAYGQIFITSPFF